MKKVISTLLLFLLVNLAGSANTDARSQMNEAEDDEWSFYLKHYMLVPLNIKTDVTALGITRSFTLKTSDFFSFDDIYTGSLRFEARRDALGLYTDLSYTTASDSRRAENYPLLTGKWSAAIDTVGGEMLAAVIRQIKHNGIVACCGNVLGNQLQTNILPFILRGITLAGIDSGITLMELRTKIWNRLAEDWKPVNLHKLSREISFVDLPDEFQKILDGKQVGKVLINLL